VKLKLAQSIFGIQIFRSRLKLHATSQAELLPIPLLRKYIAYARDYVHPRMNEQAKQEILEWNCGKRGSREIPSPSLIDSWSP
jgi:DNA replicative helicase MCM subunit Mcm2 (Cdc46/Mcm family)